MTVRSIATRLLATATVMASMTVASGVACAQVHPRSGAPVSQIQVQAGAAETAGLAAFHAEATGSTSAATPRAPSWITAVRAAASRVTGIAALVRGGQRAPLSTIHF
ncbi:hypothetical protein [Lentzea flaviverrucosa]|uniref:Uncharacterized protein n=1 Tax=Lentzea flaviverrucosa TaxID=200379 RepID=A0A1H9EUQ5_9PSEU|nr:hypothetical protein [Lentzea flaviverrucosa]RDI35400.1 hypothetical protein DFR72_1011151 [Lentzea flaviverrucosa]SEQ28963.1 hypothetical protein SAMN05216195_10266 [Lentzea flaviverrucosa]